MLSVPRGMSPIHEMLRCVDISLHDIITREMKVTLTPQMILPAAGALNGTRGDARVYVEHRHSLEGHSGFGLISSAQRIDSLRQVRCSRFRGMERRGR